MMPLKVQLLIAVLAVVAYPWGVQGQTAHGMEDLFTPEERAAAQKMINFASEHVLDGLNEPEHSALTEALDAVDFGEAAELHPEYKGRDFRCKGNNCTKCWRVRRFRRHAVVCVVVSYQASKYLTLYAFRNRRLYFSGKTPVAKPQPICKTPKCPLFGPACAVFYNVTNAKAGVTGCLRGEVKLFNKKVMKRNLGCFKFAKKDETTPIDLDDEVPDETKSSGWRNIVDEIKKKGKLYNDWL